jgi:uncharacterized protein YkwD
MIIGNRARTGVTVCHRSRFRVWALWVLAAHPSGAAPLLPDLAKVPALVVQETNELRREHGRPRLEREGKLEEAARDFARYLARTGRFDHDADGRTPGARARSQGYKWCFIAENIAYQYDSRGYATEALARELFDGWKKSAGHRKNLLAREATQTAVAIARSEKTGYYYAVQLFGRPC